MVSMLSKSRYGARSSVLLGAKQYCTWLLLCNGKATGISMAACTVFPSNKVDHRFIGTMRETWGILGSWGARNLGSNHMRPQRIIIRSRIMLNPAALTGPIYRTGETHSCIVQWHSPDIPGPWMTRSLVQKREAPGATSEWRSERVLVAPV